MDNTMLAIPKDSQHTMALPLLKTLEAATVPQQSSMVKVNSTANNTKATVRTRTNIKEAMLMPLATCHLKIPMHLTIPMLQKASEASWVPSEAGWQAVMRESRWVVIHFWV